MPSWPSLDTAWVCPTPCQNGDPGLRQPSSLPATRVPQAVFPGPGVGAPKGAEAAIQGPTGSPWGEGPSHALRPLLLFTALACVPRF